MGNLSLLLVDDEKPLLALLRKYLERGGYAVDVAETAQDALTKCRQSPCPFHVVVLDLNLPDMPGAQLLPLLLAADARLKVLISSGTPFSSDVLPAEQRSRVSSILKPYMPAELQEAMHSLAPMARGASV
ncbi:MAG: response regulator [Acidobacteria bacterium]|nr:response regulator [Acidobacteriota bacterium]